MDIKDRILFDICMNYDYCIKGCPLYKKCPLGNDCTLSEQELNIILDSYDSLVTDIITDADIELLFDS